MIIRLLLISVAVVAFSGLPVICFHRRSAFGQWIAATLNIVGSALGGVALIQHIMHPDLSNQLAASWSLPLGRFAVQIDAISLIFLIPIFLISALGSMYGLSYWKQSRHPTNGRQLPICWGLLAGAMAMTVLARDGVLFLAAWEIMALAAFFMVATQDRIRQVREVAWVYLVSAHVGTLCLFGFFALLRYDTGSLDLWPTNLENLTPHMAAALFLLALIGFGFKAGIMPLHIWLPGAHANAPSHVSAILSGVLLQVGVYGFIRLTALMPHPPLWWGGTLLTLGVLSAVLGIAFAAGQGDLKRLLAYSSVENVGIIVVGIGLATLGRSLDRADWVVLGLGGALFHALNQSLIKPLLFMGAGAVVHAGRTREMDLLGGLGKSMPRTFVLFLIGTLAICGLPPLNGFVGELFIYLGLFRTVVAASANWGWVGLAAPALALVGALALGTFVKVVAAVFAGAPRSSRALHAHDPDPVMLTPMWVLAACCVVLGVLPVLMIGMLDRAITQWVPIAWGTQGSLSLHIPLGWLTAISLLLLILIFAGALWLGWRKTTAPTRAAGTWDCGYARPSPRMQYTGSSFSQMVVELLAWVLLPRQRSPKILDVFPAPASFSSDLPDVVLDRAVMPTLRVSERFMGWARPFQRGPIQVYLLYVLGILVILLLFA